MTILHFYCAKSLGGAHRPALGRRQMGDDWLRRRDHGSEWGPHINHRLGPGPLERMIVDFKSIPTQ